MQHDLGLLLFHVLPIDFKRLHFKQAVSSEKCMHASQIAGSGQGRRTGPQFEMKGQIESLLEKKTPAELMQDWM